MSDLIAKDRLKSFIERIEHLEEEKKTFTDDIKDVYAELKGAGFDPKAVRVIIGRRKDPEAAAEQDAIIETYLEALGFDRTPLGMASDEAKVMQ